MEVNDRSSLFIGQMRGIKSYVLRQTRISTMQSRALDAYFSKWGISFQMQYLDLDQLFHRTACKTLEIGFGMGLSLLRTAQKHPEIDYLGIEVHRPGIGSLLQLIEKEKVSNIRIIWHDAVQVLSYMIANNSLDAVHIYFPDPWPKKRHHKRRLIQSPFVALLTQKIKLGGYLHLATDWQDYAQQMLEVLLAEPLFCNTATDFAIRPSDRPLTKFEERAKTLNHCIWDLIFEKC